MENPCASVWRSDAIIKAIQQQKNNVPRLIPLLLSVVSGAYGTQNISHSMYYRRCTSQYSCEMFCINFTLCTLRATNTRSSNAHDERAAVSFRNLCGCCARDAFASNVRAIPSGCFPHAQHVRAIRVCLALATLSAHDGR